MATSFRDRDTTGLQQACKTVDTSMWDTIATNAWDSLRKCHTTIVSERGKVVAEPLSSVPLTFVVGTLPLNFNGTHCGSREEKN